MDTNKITDPLNRGMVAGLLGTPADMVNMLRNAGRSVQNLTLMAQNKPTIPMQQDPAYGQEWWGNKLAQFGYVSPNRNAMAEFAAGLLDPTGITDTLAVKAPMLAQGLFNLGDPALMTVTKGLLAKKAYDVAPDVARAAAKNLSAPATLNVPGFMGQRGAINMGSKPDFSWVNEDSMSAAQQIFDAINGKKGKFGLRVIPPEYGQVSPSDILKPSYKWKNGEWTDKVLPGTSVSAIQGSTIEDVLSALHNLGALGKRSKNGYYYGDDVALVMGSSSRKGEDFGEWLIKDPVVVDLWKKSGKGLDPIKKK